MSWIGRKRQATVYARNVTCVIEMGGYVRWCVWQRCRFVLQLVCDVGFCYALRVLCDDNENQRWFLVFCCSSDYVNILSLANNSCGQQQYHIHVQGSSCPLRSLIDRKCHGVRACAHTYVQCRSRSRDKDSRSSGSKKFGLRREYVVGYISLLSI